MTSIQRLLELLDDFPTEVEDGDTRLPQYVVAEHLIGAVENLRETWERLNG